MPPEIPDPMGPQEWLRRARSNLHHVLRNFIRLALNRWIYRSELTVIRQDSFTRWPTSKRSKSCKKATSKGIYRKSATFVRPKVKNYV